LLSTIAFKVLSLAYGSARRSGVSQKIVQE
jgi:hypothetical protein